jgi:L-aminopeptidase/D-esterase-like protein
MIAPDMATMLGYIFTDCAIAPGYLQELLSAANQRTFSCITVDSDTSTSDTVLAFATGKAGNQQINCAGCPGADAFAAALNDVCRQLAHLVVAMAKAHRSSSRLPCPARSATIARAKLALRSPTHHWSKPQLPVKTPTGAAW